MKYAIQILWLDDGWIYVTEGSGENIGPKLFDTWAEADNLAEIWRTPGKEEYVRIVTYESEN